MEDKNTKCLKCGLSNIRRVGPISRRKNEGSEYFNGKDLEQDSVKYYCLDCKHDWTDET